MLRPFLIEEIMLDGVSGEVRGTVEVDLQSGMIEQIRCESFCFRRDDVDCPTLLDRARTQCAVRVVERVLDAEYECGGGTAPFIASAEEYSLPPVIGHGKQILAEYLASAGRNQRAVNQVRRAL
jgi:hypothetical protein